MKRLWAVIIILMVLWLIVSDEAGALIHLLLMFALAALALGLLSRRGII